MTKTKKLGHPDVSTHWRSARIDEQAKGFGDDVWLQTNVITVKPHESIAVIEKRLSEERKVKVRLSLPDMDLEEIND